MADCEFCPSAGRRFRTARQCTECSRFLCIVCRPNVPGAPYLCPDCGGGPREDALRAPDAVIQRLTSAGYLVPYWLTVLCEHTVIAKEKAEDVIVPE